MSTIFLPDTLCSIQTGTSPSVNPGVGLAILGASPVARGAPVIAQQSAGFHIQAVYVAPSRGSLPLQRHDPRPTFAASSGVFPGLNVGEVDIDSRNTLSGPRIASGTGCQTNGHLRLAHPFSTPTILSCPAPGLPVGHGAGQRPLSKSSGIVGESGFRTGRRTEQPFVQLRPAPASRGVAHCDGNAFFCPTHFARHLHLHRDQPLFAVTAIPNFSPLRTSCP